MSAFPIRRPLSLVLVAGMFALAGAASALDLCRELARGHISFDLGFLILLVAWGLWRLRPAARDWALFFAALGWLLALLTVGSGFWGAGQVTVNGEVVTGWPGWLIRLAAASLFAVVSGWVWHVLNRSDVKRLFWGLSVEPVASPNGGPATLPGDSGAAEGPPSVS